MVNFGADDAGAFGCSGMVNRQQFKDHPHTYSGLHYIGTLWWLRPGSQLNSRAIDLVCRVSLYYIRGRFLYKPLAFLLEQDLGK